MSSYFFLLLLYIRPLLCFTPPSPRRWTNPLPYFSNTQQEIIFSAKNKNQIYADPNQKQPQGDINFH